MRQCLRLRVPFDDISAHLPQAWRKRIITYPRSPSKPSNNDNKDGAVLDKLGYLPTVGGSPAFPQKAKRTNHSSLRIPGALSIDPEMRALVQRAKMKVNEDAVWLTIVSAKEYASTILKGCIGLKQSIHHGKLKRGPPGPNRMLGRPEKAARKDTDHQLLALPPSERTISPLDVQCFVATLRVGGVQSRGCTVSRLTCERALLASGETSLVPYGPAFHQIKAFIQKKLAPTSTTSVRFQKDTASESGRPYFGGLGRGAKDLAAIKRRSSSKVEGEDLSERGSESSRQTAPQESMDQHSSRGTCQASPSSRGSNVSVADSKQEVAVPARRGKGFGTKNLAAMRARSSVPPKDDK